MINTQQIHYEWLDVDSVARACKRDDFHLDWQQASCCLHTLISAKRCEPTDRSAEIPEGPEGVYDMAGEN